MLNPYWEASDSIFLMFRFMTMLTSCYMMGKAHKWATFPKCGTGLGYHLGKGLLFWGCSHHGALPYTLYTS
jgi:hypothetical protein